MFAKNDPVTKEWQHGVEAIWYRIKNKNDPEDILMDAKVDNARIY